MGGSLSAFETAHPLQEGRGQAGGCGSSTSYPGAGQCREFVKLSPTGPPDDRVNGYTQAFAIGTSVAASKLEVLTLMPSDTTTTAFFIHRDSSGHTCELWNVQGPTLWPGEQLTAETSPVVSSFTLRRTAGCCLPRMKSQRR